MNEIKDIMSENYNNEDLLKYYKLKAYELMKNNPNDKALIYYNFQIQELKERIKNKNIGKEEKKHDRWAKIFK